MVMLIQPNRIEKTVVHEFATDFGVCFLLGLLSALIKKDLVRKSSHNLGRGCVN